MNKILIFLIFVCGSCLFFIWGTHYVFADSSISGKNITANRIAIKFIGSILSDTGSNMAVIIDKSCLSKIVEEKEFISDVGFIEKIESDYITIGTNKKKFKIHINNKSQIDQDCPKELTASELPPSIVVKDETNIEPRNYQDQGNYDNQKTIDIDTLNHSVYEANSLLLGVQVQPFMEEDSFIGYAPVQINEGSFFQRLGLNSDDIITEINDLKNNQPLEMLLMLTTLDSNGPPVKLSIKRNNKKVTLFVRDDISINVINEVLSNYQKRKKVIK